MSELATKQIDGNNVSSNEQVIQELEARIADLESTAKSTGQNLDAAIEPLRGEVQRLKAEAEKPVEQSASRWSRVQLARTPGRPTALDYVERLCTDFTELRGDRKFGDDPALIGGPARWQGQPVMLLMQQKGRDTKSKIMRRFGSANPEGYRKAMRLMDMADRFQLPVISLIDTQGAYPGLEAEERGQGWAIAESIQRMVRLQVPAISVVIGEGGSGGALAIGVGNRVLIQENAWYSVISPEGAASILWKDASKASLAAEALKLTAQDLLEMGIIEEIVPEPTGGAHTNEDAAALMLGEVVSRHLAELNKMSVKELMTDRAERFRKFGSFEEQKPE